MPTCVVDRVAAFDMRYALKDGAGSDAIHTDPEYCFAVTQLHTLDGQFATGITLTLGDGNRLVCDAIEILARPLIGMDIEELMADFGCFSKRLADDSAMRWLGPHKGVVHLALASVTNACFDLWAKKRGAPLWKLLLDLTPEQVVSLLDLSYLEDVLSPLEALELLRANWSSRPERSDILECGYPGYDTSVGWMAYDDQKVLELTRRAIGEGFNAFKLKVGSADESHDLRRAAMLRDCVGYAGTIMFDANQQWSLPKAMRMTKQLAPLKPLWIEEPTHPDDLLGHVELARMIAPVKLAAGEHIPNRVMFKNFIKTGAIHFIQADVTRLAGVSEFITVSILAKKFNLPLVPHVGDMGQIHQHMALFNRIALGHEIFFLEHIPHLQSDFVFPAKVQGGFYKTSQEPGASSDLKLLSAQRP
jgi:L-fuconate dehydratase